MLDKTNYFRVIISYQIAYILRFIELNDKWQRLVTLSNLNSVLVLGEQVRTFWHQYVDVWMQSKNFLRAYQIYLVSVVFSYSLYILRLHYYHISSVYS
jgi:hypothetical protein